jgi:biopolymer transport protein ExbD
VDFRRGKGREEPEINLVPLIDVMMVILIFLMVTTTYSKYTELQINLPTADADKQLERPNEINVLVNAQGQYVINKKPVTFSGIERLGGELKQAGEGMKEPIVIISADKKADFQSVVQVMEASRLVGLTQITFTTQSSTTK